MRELSTGLVALLFVTSVGCAQALKLQVDAGEVARTNAPVVAMLENVTDAPPTGPAELRPADGGDHAIAAQVGNLGNGRISVRWIEPKLSAGEKKTYVLTSAGDSARAGHFAFRNGDGFRDLVHADTPVLRQVVKYDPEDHADTFKVFDHVFHFGADERSDAGEQFITKGAGGQYTHHRGIFFGYNKTSYGDFWHGKAGESQRHVSFERQREWAGPLAAKMVSVIHWVGADGKEKFRDTREVTAWRIGEKEIVLDYDITLETLTGKPEPLAGDAHHAGFHFRASNDLADNADKTRRGGQVHYVFPESATLIKDDVWGELSWVNANFELFGRRYSVTHMDGADNPDPTTYSTRRYGRFGAFFTSEVTPDKPLKVKYRLVIRDITGAATTQPSSNDVEAEYQSYVKPVSVKMAR